MPRRLIVALACLTCLAAPVGAACVSQLRVDKGAGITYAISKCEMKPELVAYFIMARMRGTNEVTRRLQNAMPELPPPIPPPVRKAVQ